MRQPWMGDRWLTIVQNEHTDQSGQNRNTQIFQSGKNRNTKVKTLSHTNRKEKTENGQSGWEWKRNQRGTIKNMLYQETQHIKTCQEVYYRLYKIFLVYHPYSIVFSNIPIIGQNIKLCFQWKVLYEDETANRYYLNLIFSSDMKVISDKKRYFPT